MGNAKCLSSLKFANNFFKFWINLQNLKRQKIGSKKRFEKCFNKTNFITVSAKMLMKLCSLKCICLFNIQYDLELMKPRECLELKIFSCFP